MSKSEWGKKTMAREANKHIKLILPLFIQGIHTSDLRKNLFLCWVLERRKLGLIWSGSNNGVPLSSSPDAMAKEGEVVLFGCSIALIQYSIMRWSGSLARSVAQRWLFPPSSLPHRRDGPIPGKNSWGVVVHSSNCNTMSAISQ